MKVKRSLERLLEHYYEINEGIGVHKSPQLYGAFPTDPYSHTPFGKGAQQPGMTGQVKEDVLSRFGELGVCVEKGQLQFNPCMLRNDEFIKSPQIFSYVDVESNHKTIELNKNTLAFTYCQIPVVYHLAEKKAITIQFANNETRTIDDLTLDVEISQQIFKRTGRISTLNVFIDKNILK